MPTFGFAAFLKIACMNPKPQKTELRKRFIGSSGKPYDFHRSLKLASSKYVLELETLPALLEAAKDVVQIPERKSLIAGLTRLGLWREGVSGVGYKVPPKVFESPRGLFKISAQPEFGLVDGTSQVAFQVWNTQRPDLDPTVVYALLSMLPDLYADESAPPTDFGVLSLHEPRAYLLSDRVVSPIAFAVLVERIEKVILDIYGELGSPPPPRPEDRPPA